MEESPLKADRMSKRELTSKNVVQAKAKPSVAKVKLAVTKGKPAATKRPAVKAKPKLAICAAKGKKNPVKQEPVEQTPAKETGVVLPPGYRPRDNEPFMNDRQRAFFRQKLTAWRAEILEQTRETLAGLHLDNSQHADIADRATSETDKALELRARDRQRKLVAKIDAALSRLDDGSYGYCEESGEQIGLRRLEARPIATLSLEAQERHERREKVYRDE